MNGITTAITSRLLNCICIFAPQSGPSVGSILESAVCNDILAFLTLRHLNLHLRSDEGLEILLLLLGVPEEVMSVDLDILRNKFHKRIDGGKVKVSVSLDH